MRLDIMGKAIAGPSGRPRPLLASIELELAEGEVCAVLGPSGVGKSTLLNIAAGIERRFDGAVTGRPSRIAFAFQVPRLLPWRTAVENLVLAAGISRRDALQWLDRVGLADAADVYPERLSIGMAQRVNLARALAVGADLLILDEPFSALDEVSSAAMRRLVAAEISGAKAITLLVTHDRADVDALATRAITLGGDPARIVRHETLRPRSIDQLELGRCRLAR